MESQIYFESDYRRIIKDRKDLLKNRLGRQFNLKSLASAIGVQSPYLSKVFRFDADLNEDQLIRALSHLNFKEDEVEFIETLHAFQRSDEPIRKSKLKNKLSQFKRQALEARSMSRSSIEGEKSNYSQNDINYFLNPFAQLVHMFFTIPKYQNRPELVKYALQIEEDQWKMIINSLFSAQLITVTQDQNKIVAQNIHLSMDKNSPLWEAYHESVKSLATHQLRKVSSDSKNTMSAIFTCSQKNIEKIRLKVVQCLEEIEKIVVEDTNPEAVHQISVDLFPWSQ